MEGIIDTEIIYDTIEGTIDTLDTLCVCASQIGKKLASAVTGRLAALGIVGAQ